MHKYCKYNSGYTTDEKELVKQILQQMVCKIIEHVPVCIDDKVNEILNILR